MRPLAIERYGNAHALIFEDCGARPLEPTPPVDATTLHAMLGTALRAIDAFAAVHENGVVHTNLTARHLWRAPGESAIRVFDFSRAVTRAEEAPPLPAEYDGDLRYAAPELIRRGFAAADPRADYYAFGIILFRWLTGRLPFEAEDPAELAHAHFASLPPSPLAHAPHLPDAVAALVANLLAKSPHERYPSAAALRAGIGECLSAIGAEPVGGSVRPAHTIKISTEFYGRTDELATLVRAFDRVAAGAKELLLISGPPGIGKSTLSGALRDPVLSRRGCFVSGKFDQFSRNVPYAATVQAFQQLVAILLSEPERRVAEWRERLTAALGSGGRIIADVIPEIERIIGPQPVLPEPAPLEARNRFNQAFRDFLRALATADHPLCLFIDDLQWADAASLSLLDVLLRDKSIGHVMVVGAYRSTEVDPSHPVIEEAAALELAALRVTRIELSGLAANEINRLIADSLGCLAASCRDLAGHVARKTDGNPFFVGQLLQAFHDKRLISFDRGRDEWAWDMASINASGITGDIVELMRGKMALLAPEVCECLKTAACLGSMFNLQHLTRACGKPEPAVARDLAVAVEDGLVVVADGPVTTGQPYSFVHDRVQQAAYALIPPRKLERFRLQIGERLLAALSPDEIAGAPFDVVNNLNFGSRLMTTTSERRRLAQLNLAAGRAARGSLAYRDALNYLRLGIELLDPPAWIEDYRLAFDLHRECFECEYQAGNIADADSLFDTLVYRAVSTVEKVDVYYTKILLNTCAARYEEAVRIGIDALSLLKIRFPPRPAKRHLLLELAKAKLLTMRRPLDELAGLPPMAEPERVAATRILTGMSPVGYFVDPNITMLSALKILTASLRYGNAAQSSIGYTLYGLALISALKDIRTGHAFGRLGVDLSERYGDIGSRTKTAVIFAGFVGIWGEPIDRCIAMLRDAHALGLEAGDFQYANYALLQIVFLSFARGLPLDTIAAECARLAPFVRETTDVFAIESLDIWRQSVLALKGATRSGAHLASADYDETAAEARLRAAKNRTALGYFLIRKLHLTYLFGDYDAARRYGAEAENFVELLPGQVLLAEHSMYYGLTLAAVMRGTRWHRHSLARALARCKRRLSRWASVAPQNFEPMALLLEAEAASVEASGVDLLDAYDRAAASARAYRFPYIEALAAECAAAYCLRCGRIRIGQAYLLDAIEAYNSWGAAAKARQIEAEAAADGVLLPSARDLPDEPAASPKSARPAPGTLNLSAVYKTQQALAGEVELDSLLNKLMTVVLEVSGARRGALVLREAGRLMVYVVAGEAGVGPIVEPTPLDLS
ncbi:MAG: AAA family ATPase, partial [Alphaproteobacteria bacterium]